MMHRSDGPTQNGKQGEWEEILVSKKSMVDSGDPRNFHPRGRHICRWWRLQ
jgi:hypothetical protein